jgi:hypothetical protein
MPFLCDDNRLRVCISILDNNANTPVEMYSTRAMHRCADVATVDGLKLPPLEDAYSRNLEDKLPKNPKKWRLRLAKQRPFEKVHCF